MTINNKQEALPGIWDRPAMEAFAVFCGADAHSSMESLIGNKAYNAIVNAPSISGPKIIRARLALATSFLLFTGAIIVALLKFQYTALLAFAFLLMFGHSLLVVKRRYEPTTVELYALAETDYHRQNINRLEEFRDNIRVGYLEMVETVAVPTMKTVSGRPLSPTLVAADHGRLTIITNGPFESIRTCSRIPSGTIKIRPNSGRSATLLSSKELLNMEDEVQFAARIDFLREAASGHPEKNTFCDWLIVIEETYSRRREGDPFEAIAAALKENGIRQGTLSNLKKLNTDRSTPFLTILKQIDLHGLPPAERKNG